MIARAARGRIHSLQHQGGAPKGYSILTSFEGITIELDQDREPWSSRGLQKAIQRMLKVSCLLIISAFIHQNSACSRSSTCLQQDPRLGHADKGLPAVVCLSISIVCSFAHFGSRRRDHRCTVGAASFPRVYDTEERLAVDDGPSRQPGGHWYTS